MQRVFRDRLAGLLAAITLLAVVGSLGCGSGGGATSSTSTAPARTRAPRAGRVARAISAWRAAGFAYDQTIQYCEGEIAPGINYWTRCTAQAHSHYTHSAQTLSRTLLQQSAGPCARTDSTAAGGVKSVARSYTRATVIANRALNLATRKQFKRASHLPRFGNLIADAHTTRLQATSTLAALAGNSPNHCLG